MCNLDELVGVLRLVGKGLTGLSDDEIHHHQSSNRVGPPPLEEIVGRESEQQGQRQIGARDGLKGRRLALPVCNILDAGICQPDQVRRPDL